MLKHFSRIILGATATGLGAFFKSPEDSLLIEASSMIGPDFAGCFNPGNITNYQKYPHEIFSEAEKIGVLHSKGLHLPGIHTLLYKKLVPYVQNCLLLTELIQLQKHDSKIEVTVFFKNGFESFTCDELIDATVLKISNQNKTNILKISIGAVFVALQEGAVLPVIKEGELIPGGFDNEFYFQYPLEKPDFTSGRSKLLQLIQSQKDIFSAWGLAATATDLTYQVSKEYKGIAKVICPSEFSGLIEGFHVAYQN